MSKLKIITAPDDRLKKKAMQVEKFDEALIFFAKDMIETSKLENGSLASIQVLDDARFHYSNVPDGYRAQPNVIIMAHDSDELYAAVNATIIERSDETEIQHEMCLSIPNLPVKVERNKSVTVKYQDLHGKEYIQTFHGLTAIAWQHEIDHQNGVITLDKVPANHSMLLWKKLNQIKNTLAYRR